MPVDVGGYQQELPPQMDRDFDEIENYGSIIKDLTDTEKFLQKYELRLVGKKLDDNGNAVDDVGIKPRVKDERIAREFVEMIRSVANQNTHFSGFEKEDIYNSLNSLNYTMNRWLMFQGENIPLRYRGKLSMEAMNIAKASLHKANKALLLKWSKGSITEGQQITAHPSEKRNFLDFFKRRKR